MTFSEIIARTDRRLRPLMSKMTPYLFIWLYSAGRKFFINALTGEEARIIKYDRDKFQRRLWGLEFALPLFNAAGMFKNGDGYYLAAAQGAGAFLAGTSTALNRKGNIKYGIVHPFTAYPLSGAASNWMGLPNYGNAELAKKLSRINKVTACPLGVSIAAEPGQSENEALRALAEGLFLYEKAGVDFIELNESCPNVPHEHSGMDSAGIDTALTKRLEFISKEFIGKRKRNLPLIVKFSVDTDMNLVPGLMELLCGLGFDGVNFGNTSTDYEYCSDFIHRSDRKHFEYFIRNFGGGVSGKPLKEKSSELCKSASQYLKLKPAGIEFHIIRTGGISCREDLQESESAGADLSQWFTGYFERFAADGHELYKKIYERLSIM